MNDVEQFYLKNTSKKQQSGSSKGGSTTVKDKDKDKERHIPSIRKQQQDASKREAAAAKRMQELMRQFGTILRQVMYQSMLLLLLPILLFISYMFLLSEWLQHNFVFILRKS